MFYLFLIENPLVFLLPLPYIECTGCCRSRVQKILNAVRQAAEEFEESVGLSDLSDDSFGTAENIEPNRQ